MVIWFRNILKLFVACTLFLIFIFIGTFRVDKMPNTLNQDEMIFSLTAKNLAETGYDACGNKLPLFPCQSLKFPYRGFTISYYLTALFYKIHPPHSIFDIRILSVFIGALAAMLFLFISSEILGKLKNRFLYAALFSIIFYFSPGVFAIQRYGSPWYILPVTLHLALLFLIYKYYTDKKNFFLVLIPIVSALLMFDYELYRFFAPLHLIFFIAVFRPKFSKQFAVGLVLFGAAFFLIFSQTIKDKFSQEFLQNGTGPSLMDKFMFNYSPSPLYSHLGLSYYSSNNYGLFVGLTAVFFILGLAWIIGNIRYNKFFQFILMSFATFPIASILVDRQFYSNRIINLVPVYFFISLYGLYIMVNLTNRLNRKEVVSLVPVFMLALIVFQNIYFLRDYLFGGFNACGFKTYLGYNCNFRGLFDYLNKEAKNYQKIYLDQDLVFIGSYVSFFNEIMGYNIRNYKISDPENADFERNSLIVTSKIKAEDAGLKKKYKLIEKIAEPNISDQYFYIFSTNNSYD